MPLAAGSHLGPYEVLGLLGAGGMGEVYRARDPRLGREVAVKVLSGDVASDPERLARFEREARAVAALNHPNVLTVFDVGTHPAEDGGIAGTPYVVTELLEGETLRELLSRRSPTQRQVLSFAVQVARGLDAAHEKGIVHRDLKPENVFVTTDGRAKVLDLHERAVPSHGTRLSSVAISPSGREIVSGDVEGIVRVGTIDGGEPPLLMGHAGPVVAVTVSPDGKWVASASGNDIRLWPMPDVSQPPFYTLPYAELLARLAALTNQRVVEDRAAGTGYSLELAPFPGWKDVPTW